MKSKPRATPALRFPEFVGPWGRETIGNVTEFLDDCRIPLNEADRSKMRGPYPYYGASGIIDYVDDFIFDDELILLGEDGENILSRALPLAFRVSGKCWVNNHAHVLKPKEGTSIDFLCHYLENISYVEYNTGTAQPKLNQEVCKRIRLLLPAYEEQLKVAAFVSAMDEKIAQLARKRKLLVKYKKGVMRQIFDQKIRFKPDDANDYPEWEESAIGLLCKIYDGTHFTPNYQESGVPFYSVEHITSNDFSVTKYIAEEVYEHEKRRVVIENGDILMTRIGDIGTSKYISWDVKASFYVSLALIKKSSKIDPEYLDQFIKSNRFQRELHRRTLHVAFPKKINLGEIFECKVLIPLREEQEKIARFLSAIDHRIELVNEQLKKIKKFKKGLLRQMFV